MAETQTKPATKSAAQAPQPAAEAPQKERRESLYRLKHSRFHPGESKIRAWEAHIEEGTPYEKLFDPAFWDQNGYKLAMFDEIRCIPDEQNYVAWLMVVGTGVGGVRMQETRKVNIDQLDAQAQTGQYRAKFAGPHNKWRIERIADGHVESSGFATEAEANRWLADNLKALSRAGTPKAA